MSTFMFFLVQNGFVYFLDHAKKIKGTIIQRFPEEDLKDFPFPAAVELVCVPCLQFYI